MFHLRPPSAHAMSVAEINVYLLTIMHWRSKCNELIHIFRHGVLHTTWMNEFEIIIDACLLYTVVSQGFVGKHSKVLFGKLGNTHLMKFDRIYLEH